MKKEKKNMVCAVRLGHNAEQWTNEKALDWARAGIQEPVAPLLEDDLNKVKDGEMDIEKICIGCISSNTEIVGQHPYSEGSLCRNCVEKLKENIFAFGDDGIHKYCAICSNPGEVFICSKLVFKCILSSLHSRTGWRWRKEMDT